MTSAHDRGDDHFLDAVAATEHVAEHLRDKLTKKQHIGNEVEQFTFDVKTGNPANFEQIRTFLQLMADPLTSTVLHEEFSKRDYRRHVVKEERHIVGIKDNSGATICLEPSGGIELADTIRETVHGFADAYDNFLLKAKWAGEQADLSMLNLGMWPVTDPTQMPRMPKQRTHILYEQLSHRGGNALAIATSVTGMQVNLDFPPSDNDQAFKENLRIAFCLQPVATALSANSPFASNTYKGYESFRAKIWNEFDDLPRCGVPEIIFKDDLTIDDWVDYAFRNVKMYTILREGIYHPTRGGYFQEFLEGKYLNGDVPCESGTGDIYNPHFIKQSATLADAKDHLHSVWTDVRVTAVPTCELRGMDTGSRDMNVAMAALWTGLLYSEDARKEALSIANKITPQMLQQMRAGVPKSGLDAEFSFEGENFQDFTKRVLDISVAGLKERGFGEEIYMAPLLEIAETKMTQARRLIEAYNDSTQKSVAEIVFERPELTQFWEPGASDIFRSTRQATSNSFHNAAQEDNTNEMDNVVTLQSASVGQPTL